MTEKRDVFDPANYAHVRDEKVQQRFIELIKEMKAVADIRQQLRAARQEKDDERPKLEEERQAFYAKVDDLNRQREQLRQKLVPSREQQVRSQERSANYDKRQVLLIQLQSLQAKLGVDKERAMQHMTRAETLNKRLNKAMEGGMPKQKTVGECKSKLDAVVAKITKADANKDVSMLKKLLAERNELEQAKDKLEKVKEIEEKLEQELQAAEKIDPSGTEAQLIKTEKELKDVKEKIAKWEEANPPPSKEQLDAEKARKDKIRAEMDKLAEKRNALLDEKDSIGKSKEVQEKINALGKQKDDIDARVKTLEDDIPRVVVKVGDGQSISDVTGPGGAKLRTIEEDFGVVIDVRRQEGEIIVKGSESKECAECVQQILEMEAKNRMELKTQIDPALFAEFVGAKGANIQLMQAQSGTNIDITRETGDITIRGSEENINSAMEMINDFREASHKEIVKYGKGVASVMRPRIAKQWQEDFGVRMIRIDNSTDSLTILGKSDACKKAAAEITEIVSNMSDNIIHIPSTVSHYSIIGRKGETVNAIQTQTGCFVDVDEHKVTLMGKKEAIEEAKKLVEAKIQDNIREEVTIAYNPKMHNFLMRQRPIEGVEQKEKHVDPEANGDAEEEKEEKDDKPANGRPPRTHECILETLRKKFGCDRLQADLRSRTITIRGPKDNVAKLQREMRDLLAFKGYARERLQLPLPTVRWLTLNKQEPGKKGIVTRLDAVRDIEGVEEVMADNRAESKEVDIIGTEEGVAKAKARILQLNDICEKHSMTLEIPASRVGRLLGTKGSTRQEIERNNDVMLHLPARNDALPRDATVTVTIIGRDMRLVQCAIKESEHAIEDY